MTGARIRIALATGAAAAAIAIATSARADTATAGVAPAAKAASPHADPMLAMLDGGRLNPTGRTISFAVPLRSGGPIGQVQITLTPDDRLSVSVQDLVNALSRIVRPAEIARLNAAATPGGQISAEAAAGLGYTLTYDSQNVELDIQIPLSARSTRDVSLGLDSIDQSVRPDRSAPFAAFLNYRVGETYQFSGPDKGKWDFLGDFQLSGRLLDRFAFENFATVDQRADHPFTRTASRLIYDIPGPALRVTAGDLITESTGFQTDPQISGVNLSHLIDTFYPNSAISGTSSRNLLLNRDADVQILINGVPVSQIHLGPGSYDLRNLPVAQGANNVQAVITDATGQRRVQSFSFFSDAQLLTPGVSEYTLSAGVLAPLGDSGPDYSDHPAFSGFYRRGITQQLTLGFNAQAASEDQVLGFDGVLGTNVGLFSLDISGNRLKTGEVGGAARLQYSYASRTNDVYFARTIDLSIEYQSRNFIPLDGIVSRATAAALTTPLAPGEPLPISFDLATLAGTNTQALLLAGSINQPLLRNLTLQVNGNYSINRGGFGNTGSIAALLTYQAPYRTTFGLGLTYQWQPSDNPANLITGRGLSILATITHRFGPQSTVTATADRFEQRATFSRSPERAIDDYFVNADVSHNDLGTSGNATVGYETNRGDIEAVYDTALDRNGHIAGQQAGVFFNGSIDLADLRLGLGRQITDSFAVIGEDKSLGGRQILVETRFANQVVARSGLFGPAVVPISSYNPQVIPYDVKNLPPGYDLGSGNFQIYPWYHSGFSLKVGSAYNISAIGDLVDQDGKPVSLATGTAISLSDPKAPHVEVITNRAGHFAALGMAPGRYRITMSGDSSLVYDISVAQTPQMFVRFGVLHPLAQEQGKKR